MSTLPEQAEIDFLILADKADVLSGKLYMMGGAWDRQHVLDFAHPVQLSIVVGILVPWNLTNRHHAISIAIENDDGTRIGTANGGLTVGRPPDATSGQLFRAIMVLDGLFKLGGPGAYRVSASINGEATKTTAFYAVQKIATAPATPAQ